MDLRRRVAARVTDIRARGQRLVQLNLELLVSELKEKGRKFAAAIGLFLAAGLLSVYAVGFLLATVAVLLALVLPLWAALLIVTVALFVLVAILVLVGRDQLRKIGDPKPEAAIAEAKASADMIKANARGTVDGVAERLRLRRSASGAGPAGPPVPQEPPLEWSTAPPPPPSGPAQPPAGAAPTSVPSAGTGTAGVTPEPPAGAAPGPAGGAAPEPPKDPEKDS